MFPRLWSMFPRLWSMFPRLWLALVPVWSAWSSGQRLDYGSWSDLQGALSDGLCSYGNSVECCWGWSLSEQGRCRPHCPHGCKRGACEAPDRCRCEPGFTGKTCNQDLNECGLKPRPCKHRCVNFVGSYKCYCADGYTLQSDGSCKNARTCFHANCQYGCEVIKGAVRCTCPSPGLRLGPDRRSCVDINECLALPEPCPDRRKCVNTFGSFVCRCHLGLKLTFIDGRYSCIDKDSRSFCSLNPGAPKCRCKDGSCKEVPKVKVEPQTPRTTRTTVAPTTTSLTTTTTAASTAPPAGTTTSAPPTSPIAPSTAPITTTVTPTTASTTQTPPTTLLSTTAPPSATLPTTTAATTPLQPTTPPQTTSPAPVTTTPWSETTIFTTTTAPPTTTELGATTIKETTEATTTLILKSSTSSPPPPTTTVDNRVNKEVTHRQRGDVHIPRHPSQNQVWEFDIELGNTADETKDDPHAGVLECSFDRGLCDWTSDREGDLSWEITRGPRGEAYLSVPPLKPGQRSVRGARLSVPIAPPWSHSPLCFSFSHWLTGHHVGVLQLFLRGRDHRYGSAVWSRTGGHGWRHTEVTLDKNSVDRVLLKAERRRGQWGQVAVDDFSLRRGPCR